jgi:hypothetical protein
MLLGDKAPSFHVPAAKVIRSIALLRLVVPQTEATLDWWVFARAAIFSSTRREVSPPKSFGGPYMSVVNVSGDAGISEVGVNM